MSFIYSILPTIVAVLFLFYGLYVVNVKGLNRITTAFLILCVATFFWQFAWAILFQVENAIFAIFIIKIGWFLILFLPTSLYHFLTEITGRYKDLIFVYISYAVSGFFSIILIFTNDLIDGYYEYFFGYYPKAGFFHIFHVLQTAIVVSRGLYITYRKQKVAQAGEKTKLRYCISGLLIYFLAAVDYFCNYGFEFYPPGVVFVCVSLGILAIATARYQVMDNSRIIASSIAHEMRTPLATLRSQSQILSEYLPELISSYINQSSDNVKKIPVDVLYNLSSIVKSMGDEARSINDGIDSLLALTSYEYLNRNDFHVFEVSKCVTEAVVRVSRKASLISLRNVHVYGDFSVYASKEFLAFVIINLINNSIDSIKKRGHGNINIYIYSDSKGNRVEVTDTGCGIDEEIMPHIFDKFFTTKKRGKNSGVGLAFAKAVMESFGASIVCQSRINEYATFELHFKSLGKNY